VIHEKLSTTIAIQEVLSRCHSTHVLASSGGCAERRNLYDVIKVIINDNVGIGPCCLFFDELVDRLSEISYGFSYIFLLITQEKGIKSSNRSNVTDKANCVYNPKRN